jgi:hypothetical protein
MDASQPSTAYIVTTLLPSSTHAISATVTAVVIFFVLHRQQWLVSLVLTAVAISKHSMGFRRVLCDPTQAQAEALEVNSSSKH